jgi:hypothetical protein
MSDNKIGQTIVCDDNDLLRMTWQCAAKNAGICLYTYSSPNEFKNAISQFEKTTAIYIDSDLSNGLKGEIFSKELHQQGFTEIYLTTGFAPGHFQNMSWIKSIIGKTPPFLNGKYHERI